MIKKSVIVCGLLLGGASAARGQGAISRALAYDTLLHWNLKTGRGPGQGVTRRLCCRETVVFNGCPAERVLYVYKRNGTYRLKQFTVVDAPVDSLVTAPERALTSRPLRRACQRYFAQIARYKLFPRYEYRPGAPGEEPSAVPTPPQWIVRAVYRKTARQWGGGMFHQTDPRTFSAEFTRYIERLNRDFTQFHNAIQPPGTSQGF